MLERAVEIADKNLGLHSTEMILTLNAMASLYQRNKTSADALSYLKQSLAIGEKLLGPHHPLVVTTLCQIAEYYAGNQEPRRAVEFYQRALQIMESTFGPSHPELAAGLTMLSALFIAQDNFEEAEPMLKRGIAIQERALGSQDPATLASVMLLAQLYQKRGSLPQATKLAERVRLTWSECLALKKRSAIGPIVSLLHYHACAGTAAALRAQALAELSLQEMSLGPQHRFLTPLLIAIADLDQAEQEKAEAQSFIERALLALQVNPDGVTSSQLDRLHYLIEALSAGQDLLRRRAMLKEVRTKLSD